MKMAILKSDLQVWYNHHQIPVTFSTEREKNSNIHMETWKTPNIKQYQSEGSVLSKIKQKSHAKRDST